MSLDDEDSDMACRIVYKMLIKGVISKHHKQPQTIAGWFATHDQGRVKDVLDDMVSDPKIPVRQKGRGTVTLSSWEAGEQFLQRHGHDPPTDW